MSSYFVTYLLILYDMPKPHGARGDVCARNLSIASGDRLFQKI
jgi:hypothetical protein